MKEKIQMKGKWGKEEKRKNNGTRGEYNEIKVRNMQI